MAQNDILQTYSYFATELKKRDLAYLHVVESRIGGGGHTVEADESETLDFLVSCRILDETRKRRAKCAAPRNIFGLPNHSLLPEASMRILPLRRSATEPMLQLCSVATSFQM